MKTVISVILTIFVLTGVLAYFVVSSSYVPVTHFTEEVSALQEIIAESEDHQTDTADETSDKYIFTPTMSNEFVQKTDVTIVFGGDMMFDRYIRQMSNGKGYDHIIEDLSLLLNAADLTVANLEGPVTENESRSLYSEIGSHDNYIFTFDPLILTTLEKNKAMLVNIGNNHIGNFGADGIVDTKKFVREARLNYFGDTGTPDERRYYVKEINGQKIAFVNYNAFVQNAVANTLLDIETVAPDADHIILYTHWGEEYITHSREHEQVLAHQFIDAGVDLIIGSHPHVVQENETYKGKMIYYSLGNFVFDQYFSEDTRNGLMVKVLLPGNEAKDLVFEEIPIVLNTTGQTKIVN